MDFTFLNIGIKQVIQKFSNLNPETGTLLAFRFDTEDVQFQLLVIGTTTLPTVLVQLNSQGLSGTILCNIVKSNI